MSSRSKAVYMYLQLGRLYRTQCYITVRWFARCGAVEWNNSGGEQWLSGSTAMGVLRLCRIATIYICIKCACVCVLVCVFVYVCVAVIFD